jgi:hypothetical protein
VRLISLSIYVVIAMGFCSSSFAAPVTAPYSFDFSQYAPGAIVPNLLGSGTINNNGMLSLYANAPRGGLIGI